MTDRPDSYPGMPASLRQAVEIVRAVEAAEIASMQKRITCSVKPSATRMRLVTHRRRLRELGDQTAAAADQRRKPRRAAS